MFILVVLAIWTVLHVYVFWRIATIPVVAAHISRKLLFSVGGLLWASFIVSRIIDRPGLRWLSQALEIIGTDWVGVLFLLFVCELAIDTVTCFGFCLRPVVPALRGWAVVAAGVLSILAFVQGTRPPTVENYEISVAGLPAARDGMVLVVASDMHLGSQIGGKWLAARIAQINALHPDIVVLAGDIVEGYGEGGQKLLPIMRTLSAPLGVWAVNGNHESYGRVINTGHLLEDAGIHVLRDQWVEVEPGLVMAGVDDLGTRRRQSGNGEEFVDHALAGHPAGSAVIFVSHTPVLPERAARDGASLMISGHTHNGQIWPFNYVVRLVTPFLGGHYVVDGMPLIVCRGTGTWGPRMRLWSPGEIVKITMRSAEHTKTTSVPVSKER